MGMLGWVSRFLGGAFFGLGLTLLLAGILAGYVTGDVDVLRGKGEELVESLFASPEFLETLMLQESQYSSLEEIRSVCETNSEIEECYILRQIEENPKELVENNPSLSQGVNEVNKQIDELADKIKSFEQASKKVITGSVVLIVLGVLFTFLGYMDWKKASYKICVKGAVTSGLAAIYYKVIQNLLVGDLLAEKIQIGAIPLAPVKELLAAWITPAFDKIFVLALSLTIIFILLAVGFYFLKKKDLKKDNKRE